jgi:membrane protease YdiL (CAAX protease family)
MKRLEALMSPAGRAWGRTIAVIGGALAVYVATALLGTVLTGGDSVAGAALSNVVIFVLAIAYRWKSTGTPLAPAPKPRALTVSFWLTAIAGLAICWTAGQTAASWVYATWGSGGLDAANSAKMNSPVWLVITTVLLLAPLGEEALMRGIAYPALRKHWSPLAAAFVTATVFALLHGNLVQIALTVPLGMLLAFVYEASQRLWPVVFMHVVFNMAASFVPKGLIEGIAELPMVIALALAVALTLFALMPGRYPVEDQTGADSGDSAGGAGRAGGTDEASKAAEHQAS